MARLLRGSPPQPKLGPGRYLSPLAVETTPGQLVVRTTLAADLRQQRFTGPRRFPKQSNEPNVVHETGFSTGGVRGVFERALGPDPPEVILALPPIQLQQVRVTLAADHRRRTEQRRFPKQWLEPAETLETGFETGRVRGAFERGLGPDPPTVILALPPIELQRTRVTLAAQHRRRTESKRFGDQTYEPTKTDITYVGSSFYTPLISHVYWFPSKAVGPRAPGIITVAVIPYQTVVFGAQVGAWRSRYAPTHPPGGRVSPPEAVLPLPTQGMETIIIALVRTRPRPTMRVLSYTVYPATGEIATTLVRTRPRPTTKTAIEPVVYPQTSQIAVTLVAVAMRATGLSRLSRYLGVAPEQPNRSPGSVTPTEFDQGRRGTLYLIIGPRPPRHILAIPSLREQTVHVTLARTRRPVPAVRSVLVPPSTPSSVAPIPPTSINCVSPDRLAHRFRRQPPSSAVAPPTVLQVFAAGRAILVAVRTRVERQRHRLPDSFLNPPATLEPESVELAERAVRVALVRQHRVRPSSRLAPPVFLPATSEIVVQLVRTRPRPTVRLLSYIVYPQATPISVSSQAVERVEAAYQRRTPFSRLVPPAVLAVFAAGRPSLARIRPRPTSRRFVVPATLEPEAVAIAERTIRTLLARTRPRRTLGTRLGYTVYPATSEIQVTLVRARPRATTRALRPPQALQVFPSGRPALVRTRPRRTTAYVAPPATLQPESVELAEQTVRVALVRARPRRTEGTRLAAPVFLPATSSILVQFVRTRPRPTVRRVAAPTALRTFQTFGPILARTRPRRTAWAVRPATVVTQSLSSIAPPVRVSLARTRPRATAAALAAPIFLPATSEIAVALVRARPRATVRKLAPAQALQAFQAFGPLLARARPRRTVAAVRPPAVVTQPTFVAPPVAVALVRTRPRRTVVEAVVPATLQPESVELQEETIRVAVPAQPSAGRRDRFFGQAHDYVFRNGGVTEYDPRHFAPFRRPFVGVRPPALTISRPSQRQQTVRVALVRARPRPTVRLLQPPTVLQIQAFSASLPTLARTRPRPTTAVVLPPATLEPESVQIAERAVRVLLARIRPRPTTRLFLTPATLEPEQVAIAERTIRVRAVRTRPRPTAKALLGVVFQPPVGTVATRLVAVQRRVRSQRSDLFRGAAHDPVFRTGAATEYDAGVGALRRPFLGPRPPLVLVRVPAQRQQTVATAVVRIRPRPKAARVYPPTKVISNPPVVTTILSVQVALQRPLGAVRRDRYFGLARDRVFQQGTTEFVPGGSFPRPFIGVRPPLLQVAISQRQQTVQVAHVTTRPRRTRRFVAPPATLEPESVALLEREIRVSLARTRPRPTTRSLPRVVVPRLISKIVVVSVRTRPRRTVVRAIIPATLEPYQIDLAERTVRVSLVRARPRPTTRRLAAPPARPQVFRAATVTLARTRPRPVRSSLRAASVAAVLAAVRVALARSSRPRRPSSRLAPPTALQTFRGPVEVELAARIPLAEIRRPVRSKLAPPAALATFQAGRPALVRRPRVSAASRLAPPAVTIPRPLAPPEETEIRIALAAAPRRRYRSFYLHPASSIAAQFGWTAGTTVAGDFTDGGTVGTAATAGTDAVVDATEGQVRPVAEWAGETMPTSGTDGHDKGSGTP